MELRLIETTINQRYFDNFLSREIDFSRATRVLIYFCAKKFNHTYLKARREEAIAGPRIITEVKTSCIAVTQNVLQSVSRQLKEAESKES